MMTRQGRGLEPHNRIVRGNHFWSAQGAGRLALAFSLLAVVALRGLLRRRGRPDLLVERQQQQDRLVEPEPGR